MLEVSSMPKPSDPARPSRRRFTHEYKERIVQEYDALSDPHEKGALLRREGLYSSHLSIWRSSLRTPAPRRKRGRKPAEPLHRENERLRKQVTKLGKELEKANKIIEVQGKVSALLHQLAEKSQADPSE
jgi:transposase